MTISPSYPYTLTNGTTADATQVMADFLQIQNDVNTNAAHNGANSDITSISGLTTPLGQPYGGTGSATAAGARTNLGLGTAAVENLDGEIIDDGAGNLTIKTNAALAGSPTTTTQSGTDNSTKIATTAQVQAAIADKIAKIIPQVFSTAGTSNYTPSPNLLFSDISAQGAGASGASTAAASNSASSSGGSGTFAKVRATATQITAALSGGVISVVVGAGGAAPSAGTNSGNNGGATTVTGLVVCPGGAAGVANTSGSAAGGLGGGSPTITGTTTLDIQLGQQGGDGGNSFLGIAGPGGSCPFGQGGALTTFGGNSGAGKAGTGNGSGGSGAASGSNNTGTAAVGGAGTDGYVIFLDYCSA